MESEESKCRLVMAGLVITMILTGSAASVNAKGHNHGHHHHHHTHHVHAHHHHDHDGNEPGSARPDVQDPSATNAMSQRRQEKTRRTGGFLSTFHYSLTCPLLKATVRNVVQSLITQDNTLPAAWLRLHFHDCFVNGCDASVLINGSDPSVEAFAKVNQFSIRGMDEIETVKNAVEQVCPGVVSCADILALVARDGVYYLNGAYWSVPLGRKDGLSSSAAAAEASLPSPKMSYSQLVSTFAAVGLSVRDMVVLSGAHTIGLTKCVVIANRIYNFPGTSDGIDPTLDKAYAAQLQQMCPPALAQTPTPIPLDPTAGNQTFDSQYFTNVLSNKGLLASDAVLLTDSVGQRFVQRESGNIFNPNTPFFYDFGNSMEKMGRINVLTGQQGEIRTTCRAFNTPAPLSNNDGLAG